jgi:hypothetical protein
MRSAWQTIVFCVQGSHAKLSVSNAMIEENTYGPDRC